MHINPKQKNEKINIQWEIGDCQKSKRLGHVNLTIGIYSVNWICGQIQIANSYAQNESVLVVEYSVNWKVCECRGNGLSVSPSVIVSSFTRRKKKFSSWFLWWLAIGWTLFSLTKTTPETFKINSGTGELSCSESDSNCQPPNRQLARNVKSSLHSLFFTYLLAASEMDQQ